MAGQDEESEKFQECHDIVQEINTYTNEMMEAGRINEFPGDISKQVRKAH